MAERARLESVCAFMYREFESPPFLHFKYVNRPMLHFIKTTLEETLTEEEKYSRFIEVAEKEISPEELAEVIKYIKEKQSIIIDLPNSLDICGT